MPLLHPHHQTPQRHKHQTSTPTQEPTPPLTSSDHLSLLKPFHFPSFSAQLPMYSQQSQLPGAYYGPAVPPSEHGRKRRGCLSCLCCSLLSILAGIVIVVGLAVLIFWLVLRPHALSVHTRGARLSRFALAGDGSTLSYNLTTALDIRNRNEKISFYYDDLEASALYDGERFKWAQLPGFYQSTTNTTTLNLAFTGSNTVFLSNTGSLQSFKRENSTGTFNVLVKIDGHIRFKVGSSTGKKEKLKIRCDLYLPLEGRSAASSDYGITFNVSPDYYGNTKCSSNY